MAEEQVRIDLIADDKASKKIDQVADKVEDLEKASPDVEITADDKASADLEHVRDEAEALSRVDAEIVARARVDDARADLKRLQDEMRETADTARRELSEIDAAGATDSLRQTADQGERAKSAMANMSGNVAGELGEIGGAGGLAAQSLGELAEAAAEGELSLGDLAKVAGPMAGLAAAMTVLNGVMEAAAASKAFDADRIDNYMDAIRDGRTHVEALADKLRDVNRIEFRSRSGGGIGGLFSSTQDILPVLDRAGLTIGEFIGIIEHFGDMTRREWVDSLRAAGIATEDASDIARAAQQEQAAWTEAKERDAQVTQTLTDLQARNNEQMAEAVGRVLAVKDALDEHNRKADLAAKRQENLDRRVEDTRDAFDRLRGALDYDAALANMQDAFGTALTAVQEDGKATDEDIRAIKSAIIDVAEAAGTNPVIVESQLASITQDNLWQMAGQVSAYYERNPIPLRTALARPLSIPAGYAPGTGGGGVFPTSAVTPPPAAGPTVVNVTQHLPRGWRGDPIRHAHETARRSGGLYRRMSR